MEYMLAPMEKIADSSFRFLCHKYARYETWLNLPEAF